MRIVVVDPYSATEPLFVFVLTRAGHDVVLVNSTAAGLREAICRETDAVLLEAGLPDEASYRLCLELRGLSFDGPIISVDQRSTTRVQQRPVGYRRDVCVA